MLLTIIVMSIVILMLVIFWSLYSVNAHASKVYGNCCLKEKEQLLIRLPFGIYFGWITVATIANVTVFLVYMGFNGLGIPESIWTVIVLLAGTVIGSLRLLKDKFFAYGFVFIWAYVAILYKHLSVNNFNGQYPEIVWTAIFCIIILIFLSVKVLKLNLKK